MDDNVKKIGLVVLIVLAVGALAFSMLRGGGGVPSSGGVKIIGEMPGPDRSQESGQQAPSSGAPTPSNPNDAREEFSSEEGREGNSEAPIPNRR